MHCNHASFLRIAVLWDSELPAEAMQEQLEACYDTCFGWQARPGDHCSLLSSKFLWFYDHEFLQNKEKTSLRWQKHKYMETKATKIYYYCLTAFPRVWLTSWLAIWSVYQNAQHGCWCGHKLEAQYHSMGPCPWPAPPYPSSLWRALLPISPLRSNYH